jgi:SAM-dependent methyltransferase
MYCRWALAWVSNPKEILAKVRDALRPGGRMVIQEYYQVSTFKTNPERPALRKAINAALKSFNESEFKINMGGYLPEYLEALGMRINHLRLIPKLATPGSMTWEWPKTFFHNYFLRLVAMGYLDNHDVEDAIEDLQGLEMLSYATLCCPLVIEVVAEK